MKQLASLLPLIPKQNKDSSQKPTSKRHLQLVKLAGDLAEKTREEANELGFMSRLLIMVNLPYKDPGKDKKCWIRKNGKVSIVVSAVYNQNGLCMGIPYGSYPRLILAYLITQAVKTQSPKIHLGKGFRDFIELIGLEKGGHQFKNVRKQLERILSASFSWTYETEKMLSRTNIQVSHQSELWWDTKTPDQQTLWESYISLNHHFFNEIIRHAVPLDLRVLSILKNSPLGLDLYMFIMWRTYKIDIPIMISWKSLQEQLGGQYSNINDFSKKCRFHVQRIKSIYPLLKVEFERGRIRLYPSHPI
jgi:hypothetical protein